MEEMSLRCKHMKLKYFLRNTFLEVKSTTNHSRGWRETVIMKALLRLGLKKEVRNGKWIHNSEEGLEEYKIPNSNLHIVNQLIDPTTRWWKFNTIQNIFLPQLTQKYYKPQYHALDSKIEWCGVSTKGEYIVKPSYVGMLQKIFSPNLHIKPFCQKLWHLPIPPNLSLFIW